MAIVHSAGDVAGSCLATQASAIVTDIANLGDGDSFAGASVDGVGHGAGGDIASGRFWMILVLLIQCWWWYWIDGDWW